MADFTNQLLMQPLYDPCMVCILVTTHSRQSIKHSVSFKTDMTEN